MPIAFNDKTYYWLASFYTITCATLNKLGSYLMLECQMWSSSPLIPSLCPLNNIQWISPHRLTLRRFRSSQNASKFNLIFWKISSGYFRIIKFSDFLLILFWIWRLVSFVRQLFCNRSLLVSFLQQTFPDATRSLASPCISLLYKPACELDVNLDDPSWMLLIGRRSAS